MLHFLNYFFHYSTGVSGKQDVYQTNNIWANEGESATIDCNHTKGSTYREMYWFQQHHGESMELVVYITNYSPGDFGKFNKSKFSASKTVPESGSFTLNDLKQTDSGMYFCAVREHIVKSPRLVCTKTHRRNNFHVCSLITHQ